MKYLFILLLFPTLILAQKVEREYVTSVDYIDPSDTIKIGKTKISYGKIDYQYKKKPTQNKVILFIDLKDYKNVFYKIINNELRDEYSKFNEFTIFAIDYENLAESEQNLIEKLDEYNYE